MDHQGLAQTDNLTHARDDVEQHDAPALVKPALPALDLDPKALPAATRNIRLMHCLERLAKAFNDAGVPLMALKGAALNLTLYDEPHQRPMNDLDLMVRAQDLPRVMSLMREFGAKTGETYVRKNYFPNYYYETEFSIGDLIPARIDLHVKPLRPLRYGRLIPADAFWTNAQTVALGEATVLIPDDEEMLIHLAAHAAVHGAVAGKWPEDIRRLVAQRGPNLDWSRIARTAAEWRLALPVRESLRKLAHEIDLPAEFIHDISRAPANWRDRLALRQAPHDAARPARHVLVNALTTPGPFYVLGYLIANLLPDREHMASCYAGRHFGWLTCARVLRIIRPPLASLARIFSRKPDDDAPCVDVLRPEDK